MASRFLGLLITSIVNSMSFIDRINLYFKGCVDLEFTDEEQVYVDRVGKTNTFQDVIDLSNELYGYAKSKEEEKETQGTRISRNLLLAYQHGDNYDGPISIALRA